MSSTSSLLSPRSSRLQKKSKLQSLAGVVDAFKINLGFDTILLIGACAQCLLVLILPRLFALTPAFFLLGLRLLDTILISNRMTANPYLLGILPKKSTAQILDKNGNTQRAGEQNVAILLLGAKSNHPLGFLAPDFSVVGNYMQQMSKELESPDSQDNGFLGQTGWTRRSENGATEYLMISYWRSIDDVHAFAHGDLHKKAWLWWDRTLSQHAHIGFMHEVFEAPRGMWETIYINFQPTLLGATTYLKKGKRLDSGSLSDQWLSGLMDANRGKLKTSIGRRGQTTEQAEKDMFNRNYYE